MICYLTAWQDGGFEGKDSSGPQTLYLIILTPFFAANKFTCSREIREISVRLCIHRPRHLESKECGRTDGKLTKKLTDPAIAPCRTLAIVTIVTTGLLAQNTIEKLTKGQQHEIDHHSAVIGADVFGYPVSQRSHMSVSHDVVYF